MAPNTRRSARQHAESIASGSEYHASSPSMDVDDQGPDDEEEKVPPPTVEFTRGGRRILRKSYAESGDSEKALSEDELDVITDKSDPSKQEALQMDGIPEDEEAQIGGHKLRKRAKPKMNGVVESDDEGHAVVTRYSLRNRGSSSNIPRTNGSSKHSKNRSSSRKSKKKNRKVQLPKENQQDEEDVYVDEPDSSSGSADASLDDALGTTPEPEHEVFDDDADAEGEADQDQGDGRPYALRQRAKINYAIPPPLEEMKPPSPKPRRFGRTNSRGGNGRTKVPGWSATGAELSKWMGGGGGDDSVCLNCAMRDGFTHVHSGFRLCHSHTEEGVWSWWYIGRALCGQRRHRWAVTRRPCSRSWYSIKSWKGRRCLYV